MVVQHPVLGGKVKRLAWAAALGLVGFSVWAYFALGPQEVPFVSAETRRLIGCPAGSGPHCARAGHDYSGKPGGYAACAAILLPRTARETAFWRLDFREKFCHSCPASSQKAGGLITRITRRAGTVLILATDIPFWTGNYVLEAWTQPCGPDSDCKEFCLGAGDPLCFIP